MGEVVKMSDKELHRYGLILKVIEKRITQKQAAELLHLSDRQVRNLITCYIRNGAKGLTSKQRGKPSNRAFSPKLKSNVMALIREKYPDFSPTFACEKLLQYHDIKISKETLRKWMMQGNLWISRKHHNRLHLSRPRRDHFGELIQIDASIHPWFEDRGEKCALIVFIDDATSRLTSLFFCESECLNGYFNGLEIHIKKYGRPCGLYSDRHAIFGGGNNMKQSQFTRALRELDIKNILATSPQAKGRVERVNRTLQDRLIKEMRLRNISTIEEANRYLPEFVEEFNKKFSKEPRGQIDAHRPLASGCDLERTLTRCETRTLSKSLSFSFYNKNFQILESNIAKGLQKKVEIRVNNDGTFRVFQGDRELKYTPTEQIEEREILDSKEKITWKTKNTYHPPLGHPWKHLSYATDIKEHELRKWRKMI
jgi:hypothetical protein